MGVDWWGRVWDNDPARQPPPYPGPEATWRDVAYAVHDLLPEVSDVWWAVLPEPGEVHATALWPDALRRARPGVARDRMYEVLRETLRLAGDWERGGLARAPAPALSARPRRHATPHGAAPSAARHARPWMGTGADSLILAQRDLGQRLSSRHAWLPH